MKSYDFEYDGLTLSDMGYMMCKFDSSSMQTISNGSQITFNTVSFLNGKKYELTDIAYDECLKTTFQICKNPCNNDDLNINVRNLRDLVTWLNRKEFHKFKLLNEEYMDLYFESSFNVSTIEFGDNICGLELEMITNRPFALHEPISFTIKSVEQNTKKIISDISDEEGYIYPHTEIEILEDGVLTIHNDLENRTMEIKDCIAGEKILLDYPLISSSIQSHKIQDDFNWNFFRIYNTFRNNQNTLTISIPCIIKIEYSPIVKVGL
ncbi:MAG: hypothetical protein HFH04_03395 [Dorea sp.]|nr:hypothetical protein [Dorea sp.]